MSNDHDWRKMLNEMGPQPDHEEYFYDRVDMQRRYDIGFWVGAISGSFLTIAICLLVGLYFNGWQLP